MAIDRYIAQLIGFAKLYQETTWEMEIIPTNIMGNKNIALIGLDLIHDQIIFIYLIEIFLYQFLSVC
jgi:hypothetical protein